MPAVGSVRAARLPPRTGDRRLSCALPGTRRRSTKAELRANLVQRLRDGQNAFPGIVGFDDTVLPELESALLAGS